MAETVPSAVQSTVSAKVERARDFFEMGNAYAAKGLFKKAYEYWDIARELDPSIATPNGGTAPAEVSSAEQTYIPPVFESNSDRPYDNMVENLYGQAVKSFLKGDNLDAIDYLKQAKKIDPIQSQVQDFLGKIQVTIPLENDPLENIRQILKNGKNDEALARLEDYLVGHPNDKAALKLKNEIEVRTRHTRAIKQVLKRKKTFIVEKPIPETDLDRQAKADQAYNLGLESYRQTDYVDAKKFWVETLQIQPTHQQARRNLDRLLNEHPELK